MIHKLLGTGRRRQAIRRFADGTSTRDKDLYPSAESHGAGPYRAIRDWGRSQVVKMLGRVENVGGGHQ